MSDYFVENLLSTQRVETNRSKLKLVDQRVEPSEVLRSVGHGLNRVLRLDMLHALH
jgi:hypothetical protein